MEYGGRIDFFYCTYGTRQYIVYVSTSDQNSFVTCSLHTCIGLCDN